MEDSIPPVRSKDRASVRRPHRGITKERGPFLVPIHLSSARFARKPFRSMQVQRCSSVCLSGIFISLSNFLML